MTRPTAATPYAVSLIPGPPRDRERQRAIAWGYSLHQLGEVALVALGLPDVEPRGSQQHRVDHDPEQQPRQRYAEHLHVGQPRLEGEDQRQSSEQDREDQADA